jgi:hypothetical protein
MSERVCYPPRPKVNCKNRLQSGCGGNIASRNSLLRHRMSGSASTRSCASLGGSLAAILAAILAMLRRMLRRMLRAVPFETKVR